ncbi:MAG: glycosyltransferase [Phycisphaera sp.]|nr:glycosyltransferase [Phycisphaera sp.]
MRWGWAMRNQDQTRPRVTVLMPVYNAGRYLEEAVRSVLDQTWQDFELLVIDDGSTDGSGVVLDHFAQRDSRVRVVHQSNAGIVNTLNRGLAEARGELLARMDADDIAMPERLADQVAYLDQHPECVVVGGRILLIDPDGMPIREMCEELTHEEIDRKNLEAGGAAINHPSATFRLDAARKVGSYRKDYEFGEDLDLWLRLAEVGRMANLPGVVTQYRMHAASISHDRAILQRTQWRRAAMDAKRRRGLSVEGDAQLVSLLEHSAAVTVASHHNRWAWWALMSGYRRTARKHALATLKMRPLAFDSWRLFACALRGR